MSTKGYVYFIGPEGADEPIKVGWSAKHPGARIENLQIGNPRLLILVGFVEGCRAVESYAHEVLSEFHCRGEWFERGPALDLLIELGKDGPTARAFKRLERKAKA